jgi:hypothetical protein
MYIWFCMYIEFMTWQLLFVVDFSVSDRTATTTKHSAEKGAKPYNGSWPENNCIYFRVA